MNIEGSSGSPTQLPLRTEKETKTGGRGVSTDPSDRGMEVKTRVTKMGGGDKDRRRV